MNLIKRKQVRQMALEIAHTTRPAAGFTRVSKEFFDDLEVKLRSLIREKIHKNPSTGVTLR